MSCSRFRSAVVTTLVLLSSYASLRAQGEKVRVYFQADEKLHFWWSENAEQVAALDAEVSTAVAQLLGEESELRFWAFEGQGTPAEGAMGIVISLFKAQQEDENVLCVRVEARSKFLGQDASLDPPPEKEWVQRLALPAELEMRTITGVPPREEVPGRVGASVAELLAAKARSLRLAVSRGIPVGHFAHEISPRVEDDQIITVLPIDSADVRKCPLRFSKFDVRCGTPEKPEIRLSVSGTGVLADYPAIPGVPEEEQLLGVKVRIEKFCVDVTGRESVTPSEDASLLCQAKLRLFFLLELVETSDLCHEGELAVADLEEEGE